MARRLILCLDGTDNSPTSMSTPEGAKPEPVRTNVSRLFRMLSKNPVEQMVYYQPGVGTIDPERSFSRWDRIRNTIGRISDSIAGWMLSRHATSAYQFLMNQYQDGDEIMLFGFSRGSYVSRLVAGMIHKVGLLHRGHDELINFAWQVYAPRDNFEAAARFKKFYSQPVTIRFLGLWDTVSSIGNPFSPKVFPYTLQNDSVQTVRHAMAIDERRVMFQPNLWTDRPKAHQDVLQVWFPGAHADIGGGYTGDSSPGLAGIPLAWMIREARAVGVEFLPDQEKRLLWPKDRAAPDELSVQTVTDHFVTADQHDEIAAHWYWNLAEKIPVPRWHRESDEKWTRRFRRHKAKARGLLSNEGTCHTIRVHQSADLRVDRKESYDPENLKLAAQIPRVW